MKTSVFRGEARSISGEGRDVFDLGGVPIPG